MKITSVTILLFCLVSCALAAPSLDEVSETNATAALAQISAKLSEITIPENSAAKSKAVDISVSTGLLRPQISRGEMAELQVRVTGADRADVPQEIKVEGLEIRQTGQSTQVQMVNFKVSTSVVYSYIVNPLRTGNFTIPGLKVTVDGRQFRTPSLSFKVDEAKSQSFAPLALSPDSSQVIESVSSKQEAYDREQKAVTEYQAAKNLFESEYGNQGINRIRPVYEGRLAVSAWSQKREMLLMKAKTAENNKIKATSEAFKYHLEDAGEIKLADAKNILVEAGIATEDNIEIIKRFINADIESQIAQQKLKDFDKDETENGNRRNMLVEIDQKFHLAKKLEGDYETLIRNAKEVVNKREMMDRAAAKDKEEDDAVKDTLKEVKDAEPEKDGGPSTKVVIELSAPGIIKTDTVNRKIIKEIRRGNPLSVQQSTSIPAGTTIFPIRLVCYLSDFQKELKDCIPSYRKSSTTNIDLYFYKDEFGDWKIKQRPYE
jgi:hypothetical protein